MSEISCFVAMPITTPPNMVDEYGGDPQHFKHVLDHLFIPAIERAEMRAITPIVRGGDLIHAEIIKNLEEADLVLCDLSTLNPNVFLELGVRTALDRPIALVKDDKTPTTPFDTSIINHHEYSSDLAPWILAEQLAKLHEHIEHSMSRSEGRNSLWKYFGLTQRGEPPIIENPLEEKMDLALREISLLRRGMASNGVTYSAARKLANTLNITMQDAQAFLDLVSSAGNLTTSYRLLSVRDDNVADIVATGHISAVDREFFSELFDATGIHFTVREKGMRPSFSTSALK